MRKEMCKDCLCNSCMGNAEDYADGTCRECEQCEIEERNKQLLSCKFYESDNDPSSLLIDNSEPGKPTYDEVYYEEHEDEELEDKYLNSMW